MNQMSAETDATIADDEEFEEEEDENQDDSDASSKDARRARRPLAVAIVGRPNAGKSSLLNAIAGGTRAIVSPVAGTTRDAVDAVVRGPPGSAADGVGSRLFRLVDTAGIRRRAAVSSSPTDAAEGLAVGRALSAMRRADVVALVVDAEACSRDGRFVATAQDFRLAEAIAQAGRACVIVLNKWDAVPNREVSWLGWGGGGRGGGGGAGGRGGRPPRRRRRQHAGTTFALFHLPLFSSCWSPSKRSPVRSRAHMKERERQRELCETFKLFRAHLTHTHTTHKKNSSLEKNFQAVDRRDVRGRGPRPAPPRRVGPRRPRLGGLGPKGRQGPLGRGRGRGPARAQALDRDAQHGRARRRDVAGAPRQQVVAEKGPGLLRDAARDEAADFRAVRQRRVAVPGRLQEVRGAVPAGRGGIRGDGAAGGVEGQAAARPAGPGGCSSGGGQL